MTPDAYASEYECTFGRTGASLFNVERIKSLVLPGMSIQVGVTIHEGGAAIVTSEQDKDGAAVVTGIEQHSFNVDIVVERIARLSTRRWRRRSSSCDGDGLGDAVWDICFPDWREVRGVVASRDRHKDQAPIGWLFQERGLERQRLVNVLVIAMNQGMLHFAPGLDAMDQMTKALVSYRRQVKDDGSTGSELVTALCLSLLPRITVPRAIAFLA